MTDCISGTRLWIARVTVAPSSCGVAQRHLSVGLDMNDGTISQSHAANRKLLDREHAGHGARGVADLSKHVRLR